MKITVVGGGYVGLVSAACLARRGHGVHILEANPARLEPLRRGVIPFYEPGLQEIVDEGLRNQRLLATSDPVDAYRGAELALICVGTPLGEDGAADMRQVRAACDVIAEVSPELPVVVRSTLPLGESDEVMRLLRRRDATSIVTNPEFLRQGSAVRDFEEPTRIVIGTPDGRPTALSKTVEELYPTANAPVLVTDYRSAEMIKNASNAFLATKLSFINELADLCESYGADVGEVARGVGMDPRIGGSYFVPGIGFGGSCLPKELANLVRLGRHEGLEMPLMAGAARVNEDRPRRIAHRIESLLGPVRGKRIAVLGLSFKPDTDDTRHSPALALIANLAERGATVIAHDPAVPAAATNGLPLARAASPEEAIIGASVVILATEWPIYRDLDWTGLRDVAGAPTVFDGRNALDHGALERAGWRVISVGRAADQGP